MVPWPVGWAERRTTAAAHARGMRLVNAFDGLQKECWTCNDIVGMRGLCV